MTMRAARIAGVRATERLAGRKRSRPGAERSGAGGAESLPSGSSVRATISAPRRYVAVSRDQTGVNVLRPANKGCLPTSSPRRRSVCMSGRCGLASASVWENPFTPDSTSSAISHPAARSPSSETKRPGRRELLLRPEPKRCYPNSRRADSSWCDNSPFRRSLPSPFSRPSTCRRHFGGAGTSLWATRCVSSF
jgi:hypothetical protein